MAHPFFLLFSFLFYLCFFFRWLLLLLACFFFSLFCVGLLQAREVRCVVCVFVLQWKRGGLSAWWTGAEHKDVEDVRVRIARNRQAKERERAPQAFVTLSQLRQRGGGEAVEGSWGGWKEGGGAGRKIILNAKIDLREVSSSPYSLAVAVSASLPSAESAPNIASSADSSGSSLSRVTGLTCAALRRYPYP